MKSGVAAVVGVVVAAVVVVGAWMWVGENEEVEDVNPAAGIVEEGQDEGDVPEGQFVQEAPDELPTSEPTLLEVESPAVEAETGETVVIEMTDSGFEPETVTIAAGTTVRFVNNGQASHWPASDVHPTHQILPGFDSRAGLATGETYEFTFTEAGSWGMHDHLFPQYTGTIVVE